MLASLLQVLSIGLGLAGYYALVAAGFALIFATLRIFHVAHGTVFIIGGYTFFGLHRLLGVDVFVLGDVAFRALDLGILVLVAAAFGALYLWLHRTSTGLEVRGLTDNADLAAVVGVDVQRTRNSIFLVASALAGLAGVLTAYDTGLVPSIGFKTLFIGVVAVILGGVRNLLLGTIVGATCLGLLTAFAGFFFPEWITFTIFLIMIVLI